MITATYFPYVLEFKRPSGTSRGVLNTKESWFLVLSETGRQGIGECGLLRGLSIDDRPDYEEKLQWVCENIQLGLTALLVETLEFPSIQFGLEQAFLSLEAISPFELFPSEFTRGRQSIPINGLVWMGDKKWMQQQIKEKIAAGFSCIKMKIGAIDFKEELALLTAVRQQFSSKDIVLRVDANGAFATENALEKLRQLADLDMHSIEQPIKQGQEEAMARLCAETPLPIALDEELLGVFSTSDKEALLLKIKPQYIILKPSLIGGFQGTRSWIALAEKHQIGWWITSALESNIGLNAIAQFTATTANAIPQGLGTGGLYTNNIPSPLTVKEGKLFYVVSKQWPVDVVDFIQHKK